MSWVHDGKVNKILTRSLYRLTVSVVGVPTNFVVGSVFFFLFRGVSNVTHVKPTKRVGDVDT